MPSNSANDLAEFKKFLMTSESDSVNFWISSNVNEFWVKLAKL